MFGLTTQREMERQLAALREEFKNAGGWHNADSGALWDAFGVVPTSAGVAVTPESSKRVSAVSACVNLIAGTIASTPLPVYRRTPDGRERAEHDYWWLLNEQPTPQMTAATWWEWMISSLLLRGDGIAEIVRAAPGSTQIEALVPLEREDVVITEGTDGTLVYAYREDGKTRGLRAEDVLHFPGYGFNGLCGESVIRHAARQAIGTALAADEHAGGFFQRGASPSVAIEYPQGVAPKPEQAEFLRQQFDDRYSGVKNAHRPLVLINGGKLSPVSLTPQDSQLLQTRQWQVIDIARAFGVPPILIGESEKTSSWGSGVEQILRAFLAFTLNPRLVGIEQELNRKLWPSRERYFVEFNRAGWLEGDNAAQADYFQRALGGPGTQGWMTVNEVRRLKNLPPIAGGDTIAQAGANNAPAPSA
jgi:HK97 family phage portal protein